MTPSKLLAAVLLLLSLTGSAVAAEDVMKWNKTPEAYYMTPAERAEWGQVASPEDARRFVDEFRRKRGPQFLKDVRTRIDLADEQFKLDKTPGSLTPRGRVWILIGSPSRSTTQRGTQNTRSMTDQQVFGGRTIESQGLIVTEWTYDADRLAPELGRKSLVVRFQTDSSRGYETIDNLGNIEPYLTQVAELVSNKYVADVQAQTAQRSVPPSAGAVTATTAPDPLWNATPNLHGVTFTGETYLSPTEEPFYAYSFYVPAGTLGEWKSALAVTLVRDANGQQLVSRREQVELGAYDGAGNRWVDLSVALPPGKYEGLFALYSPDGATLLASHRAAFEVAAKEAPRASALLLTSRVDTLPTQAPLDPFTFVATRYAVRGDRRFRLDDRIGFFTVIANPTGSPTPKLMQKMIFTRDGKEFARTPLEDAQLTQTGPHTFLIGTAFDPATFPAGRYTLELQVRDMNAPAGSELRTRGYVLRSDFEVVQ